MNSAAGRPAWVVPAAVLGALLAFLVVAFDSLAWHPAWSYGDERIEVAKAQALREGAPLRLRLTGGCLTRAVQQVWYRWAGTGCDTMHLPEVFALLLTWLCLAVLAKRWFSEESAAWSLAAAAVSAQAWVWGRSLLSFQLLPLEILALGLAAGAVRRGWAGFLWGCAGACLALDYDGALVAVPGLALTCLVFEPEYRKRFAWVAAGASVAGGLLLIRDRGAFGQWLAIRSGAVAGEGSAAHFTALVSNLKGLLWGGATVPYFGVADWPAWPVWTWAGLALGIGGALRSRTAVLLAWAALGALATQATSAPYGLPLHRMAVILLPLALLSGEGLRALRMRLGSRAWILGALLAFGFATESFAWIRQQFTFAPELYARSSGLQALRAEHAAELADPGAGLAVQLDGEFDGDARFALGAGSPAGKVPGRVLALIPAGYAAGLPKGVRTERIDAGPGLEPLLWVEAEGPFAQRLWDIQGVLTGMLGGPEDSDAGRRAAAAAWLRGHPASAADPWMRSAVLECYLASGAHENLGPDPDLESAMTAPPPSFSAPWMVLARATYKNRPEAALGYLARAKEVDPDNGEAALLEAASRTLLGDSGGASAARARWVELRRLGGWRHQQ
jgi:hypothetical protein